MTQSSASSQELSLSVTSFSSAEVTASLDTPLTTCRSSTKSRHPKSAASPQFSKVDKLTVLKFPVTSLPKESRQGTNKGLDSGVDTSEMNVSMEMVKENGEHNVLNVTTALYCSYDRTCT